MTGHAPPSALALPSYEDPVVATLVGAVGGPPGRHARLQDRRVWWTALRALIALTIIFCSLGWVQKEQCRDVRNWSHNSGDYQYTRICYSDVVALYGAEGLSNKDVPYVDHPVEYPVLTGAVMGVAAAVAHGADGYHRDAVFYDVTVLMMALAALVTVIATGLTARRRLWDAALIALAPTIVMHLGTNWDMLAVGLASVALLAWSRKKIVWAGVFLGLGAAAKLYPAFFLVPLLPLCLRAGQTRAWLKCAAVAFGTFVVANAPFWITSPKFSQDAGADGSYAITGRSAWQALRHGGLSDFFHALGPYSHDASGHITGANGVLRFWHLSRTRGADWDSLWYMSSQARSGTDTWLGDKLEWITHIDAGSTTPDHLNLVVEVCVILVTAGVFALALLAPQRPRLPQLLFLWLAGFMILNKVDSPQYTLWLLPLVALALPHWRIFLAWQVSEVVLTITRFMFFIGLDTRSDGTDKGGVGYDWFGATVLIRDGILVAMMCMVVWQVLHPDEDKVRADGDDDPAGGVLDGAEDRLFRREPAADEPRPVLVDA